MLGSPIVRAYLFLQKGVRKLSTSSEYLAGPPRHNEGPSEDKHREARTWLARFDVNTIPKNICEVSFSRASGPGGQNVNKYEVCSSLDVYEIKLAEGFQGEF